MISLQKVNPLIFSANASDQDNPHWYQVVNGEFVDGFWEAMKVEIDTLPALEA